MLAKDKFSEKISLIVIILSLCFSPTLNAEKIYEKIFIYNDELKNTSANFIQTNINNVQEGVIYFGNKRIKNDYKKPKKITIIISEKKGIYTNHELEESQFFATKNSYVKFLFNVFNKKNMEDMVIEESNHKINVSKNIKLDNIYYNIKLIYENDPIKIRKIIIIGEDNIIEMGLFGQNNLVNKKNSFFSLINPYLY